MRPHTSFFTKRCGGFVPKQKRATIIVTGYGTFFVFYGLTEPYMPVDNPVDNLWITCGYCVYNFYMIVFYTRVQKKPLGNGGFFVFDSTKKNV
jgi:hypothetical protein